MSKLKARLTELIHNTEQTFDSLKSVLEEKLHLNGRPTVHPYFGYGTADTLYLRGRVLASQPFTSAETEDTIFENLLNTYRHINSDEIGGATIEAICDEHTIEVTSDEEGYFFVTLPAPATDETIIDITLTLKSPLAENGATMTTTGKVFRPSANAQFGVISDIDDTVMYSSATNYLRAAQLMFLRNFRTRTPFPGVATLYQALNCAQDSTNPMFYISSSPWNLFDLLTDFFELQGVPWGPLFLKDYGITEDTLLSSGHGKHKMTQFDTILATYPDMQFVILGDNGQKDPEIYSQVIAKYPGRIKAAYIRVVSKEERYEESEEIARNITDMTGVPMILAGNSLDVANHAQQLSLLDNAAVAEITQAMLDEEADTPLESL